MKLVLIDWIDAVGGDGWVTEEELQNQTPMLHHSVGYVVKDTKDHVTISMSYNEKKNNMGAWLLIPKKYIKKVKKL